VPLRGDSRCKRLHGLSCSLVGRLDITAWTTSSGAPFQRPTARQSKSRRVCKRSDTVTSMPWKSGRCVTWDATVTDRHDGTYTVLSAAVITNIYRGSRNRKIGRLIRPLIRRHVDRLVYSPYNSGVAYSFVPIAAETNDGSHQQLRHRISGRPSKAHLLLH